MRYKYQSGTVVVRTATITDASNGVAEYQMIANELIPGTFDYEWEVIDTSGRSFIGSDVFSADVAPKLA